MITSLIPGGLSIMTHRTGERCTDSLGMAGTGNQLLLVAFVEIGMFRKSG